MFEATCTENTPDTTTPIIISSLNALALLSFVIAIWWVRRQQEDEITYHESTTCRPADYTAVVTLPSSPYLDSGFSRLNLIEHFERTLSALPPIVTQGEIRVADVNFSTSCYQYMHAALQRGAFARRIDTMLASYVMHLKNLQAGQPTQMTLFWKHRLRKLLYDFEHYNRMCKKLEVEAISKIHKAFVTFDSEEGLLRCLEYYPSAAEDQDRFDGVLQIDQKSLYVGRCLNPSEIRWENTGIPLTHKIAYVLRSTFALVTLLLLSYIAVAEIQFNYSASPGHVVDSHCSTYKILTSQTTIPGTNGNTITYEKVLWDENPAAYNKSSTYGDNGYLKCFCESLASEYGKSYANSFQFYDISINQNSPWCASLYQELVQEYLQYYYIGLVMLTFNSVFMWLAPILVELEHWESLINASTSLMLKSFFFQYINTALLVLIIYGNLEKLTGINIGVHATETTASNSFGLGGFSGRFGDFSNDWYGSIGVALLFTMLVFPVFNRIYPSHAAVGQLFRRLWDMRTGRVLPPLFSKTITHASVQTELDELYVGYEFPIEAQYGSVLANIYIGLTYGNQMQYLPPLILRC